MTSRDLFSDLPRKVADALKAVTPGLRECEAHEMRLSLEELAATRIAAPAIRVVMLGARAGDHRAGAQLEFNVSMAAFIIATDAKGLSRDAAALNIAQAVMTRVVGSQWGDQEVGPAANVAMEALSNSATRKAKIALRAVTWTQPVVIDHGARDVGELPGALYLGMAPDIGAGHEGDYDLVSGEEPAP